MILVIPTILCVSFSRTAGQNEQILIFLHNSQWIVFPTQSCLLLNFFCFSFLHSLIMQCLISVTILLLLFSLESFSHQRKLMVFHWGLSESKPLQVSRTLLNILADLNNALVWIVSTHPLISKSPSLYINPLVTVPISPVLNSFTVTFLFQCFFSCLARSMYLSLFSLSFNFTLWLTIVYFLLTIIRSGCLAEIRWSVFIPKSKFCAFHF